MKDTIHRTLNDSSTIWSSASGMFGALTVSEWCLLITGIVTVLNFIKNYYIDMEKLKLLKQKHQFKILNKGFDDEKDE